MATKSRIGYEPTGVDLVIGPGTVTPKEMTEINKAVAKLKAAKRTPPNRERQR